GPTRPPVRWLLTVGFVALGYVAAVAFRAEVLAHAAAVAALCWLGSVAVVGAASGSIARRLAGASAPRAALAFSVCAAALVCLLFAEAVTDGLVLSQADIYFDYQPWSDHRPPDYHRLDRPPLDDVPMLVYPFAVFTQARWREGVFPLWTSGMASGQP